MSERRTADDISRLLADYDRRIAALERGQAGTILIPAGHPGGGVAAAGVTAVPFLASGIVTDRTLWTMPVVSLTATTTITLRVESAGSWTVTAGALRYAQTETAVTSATHAATGPWSGTLVLSNGGGTPTTACVLYLSISISTADQARVVTSSIVGS